ncbi:DNA-3-methyladenine glycosylase 2 family protein [Gammaproteobacteria bacterium]|mgnify:FL=1|nr:DNA-3-methyladenine glycosylase 2 family protein [Gammaproteobacteria bacterium]
MTAKKAYAHLLDISKRHKHRNLHKFLQNSEIISIDARVDTSLSLKYFLIKTVIGQQVSVKAAQSIWLKVKNVLDKAQQPITIELLKKQGLSKPKAAYIFGIINNKFIEEATIAKLKKLSLEDLSHFFLQLKGVGPWTLGVVRMFFIQDTDVFLEGDLGINKALENFFNSQDYSGKHYSPYRTYLCLYLWKSLNNN